MPLRKRWIIPALFLIWASLPEWPQIPVQGASARDWNPRTFWFEPWGRSGVHKGIDIFAKQGTPALSASYGVVLFRKHRQWWIHYLIQWFLVTVWYWITPLLLGFVVVFCFWHALQSMQYQLDYVRVNYNQNRKKTLMGFVPFGLMVKCFLGTNGTLSGLYSAGLPSLPT